METLFSLRCFSCLWRQGRLLAGLSACLLFCCLQGSLLIFGFPGFVFALLFFRLPCSCLDIVQFFSPFLFCDRILAIFSPLFCLWLCSLRLGAILFSFPFSFRNSSPDISYDTCLFFFHCCCCCFRLRCSYPLDRFADAPPRNGAFPAVATDLVTITRTMLRQPSFKSGRCLLYVAYTASPPAPSFPRTIQTHSTAIACPFPRRGRKFLFGFASVANTAQLCLLARLTNTIKCGLWTCMFCHECIFLFPGRACHALPRLLRLHVPMNALFADSSRICAFPSTSRERRGRL